MAYTNFEYFQTLYEVTYNASAGTALVITGNKVSGGNLFANLSISSGTELTSGTSGSIDTISVNSKTGTPTTSPSHTGNSSFTYIGTVSDNGNIAGILFQSGTSYWVASVYVNGYTANFVSNSTTLTVNTSQGWNLDGTNYTTPISYTENGNPTPACFLAGTMIATPSGETPVENLQAGDLVSLSGGGTAPVTWLGSQTISMLFADPLRVAPIRIKAGALADGVPCRDLLLSPEHAVLVDGILAQAGALVNNISIARETNLLIRFTYYHVEVAEHSLILAENTPAETFIDNIDRLAFDNWDEHPGTAPMTEMDLPRAKAARQLPAETRARLLARCTTAEAAAA